MQVKVINALGEVMLLPEELSVQELALWRPTCRAWRSRDATGRRSTQA